MQFVTRILHFIKKNFVFSITHIHVSLTYFLEIDFKMYMTCLLKLEPLILLSTFFPRIVDFQVSFVSEKF